MVFIDNAVPVLDEIFVLKISLFGESCWIVAKWTGLCLQKHYESDYPSQQYLYLIKIN